LKQYKFKYPILSLLVFVWLFFYIPAYTSAHGVWHFLQLCNLGVLLSCLGVFFGSNILLSSQAVATPMIGLFWVTDYFCKLITGRFIHGGTAYMWDVSIPWFVRALSFYHLFLPIFLIYFVHKIEYDVRGWRLQSMIGFFAILLGLFLVPESENLNYVYHWPNGRVLFNQPFLHAMFSFVLLVTIVYWPAHYFLKKYCSKSMGAA
jgi:hypothetical protein